MQACGGSNTSEGFTLCDSNVPVDFILEKCFQKTIFITETKKCSKCTLDASQKKPPFLSVENFDELKINLFIESTPEQCCAAETEIRTIFGSSFFARIGSIEERKLGDLPETVMVNGHKYTAYGCIVKKPSSSNISIEEYCAIGKRSEGWEVYDGHSSKISRPSSKKRFGIELIYFVKQNINIESECTNGFEIT